MTYQIEPIGFVHNERAQVEDDNWGDVVSTIELDASKYTEDALRGLDQFSHLEIVFYMDRVSPGTIKTGARHPRNNPEWPLVGVFAQRVKARPNLLGVSRCELLQVQGLTVTVRGLDAIDRTPVIDIKPYVKEFEPKGEVHQPTWVSELMKDYF
jgi:tRNA-Thr(GGU) m(6)t(6)A37 methyltransferase TsaA